MMGARGWICAALVVLAPVGAWAAEWASAGQNIENTRHQAAETRIAPETVARLGVKWVAELGGDISATPAVDGDSVYVPDTWGKLYRIDRATGAIVWANPISLYTGIIGDTARTTPALAGSYLILGSQGGNTMSKKGARVVAVHKATGASVWRTTIEAHPAAVITQSAVIHADRVYVGVSSWEEYVAAKVPGYECCGFRGSVVALGVTTGEVIWKTHTAPDAPGYAGNAVFGGTPALDAGRGLVYVTTGNSYRVPETLLECVAEARRAHSEDAERACIAGEPANHVDAFVALDTATGAVEWAMPALPFDPYTLSCYEPQPNPGNCPSPSGPDYDFAQGPALFTVAIDGRERDLVGAGQKSGIYWALDRDTGAVIWRTEVGPGSALGGMEWGSATDGTRIYVAVANFAGKPWTLLGQGGQAGNTVSHGFWSALDAATGEILWQTADPNIRAADMGAVTVANGVVFAGSMASGPKADTMFVLDAASGAILWRFSSGGSVNSGAAVVDGVVYWGSGYRLWGGRGNNRLYAFEVE
jgi:polyvinyl alcohol dehydrogenase (cytochrome)